MALEPKGLTDAIDAAFATEWTKAKGTPAPDAGKDDRRLMFAAIARGVLTYLSAQQDGLITTTTLTDPASNTPITYNVSATVLGIDAG